MPAVYIVRFDAVFARQPVFKPPGHGPAAAHSGAAVHYPDGGIFVPINEIDYFAGHVLIEQDRAVSGIQTFRSHLRSGDIVKSEVQHILMLLPEPPRRRAVRKDVVGFAVLKRVGDGYDGDIRPLFYVAVIQVVVLHRMLEIRC